MSQFAVILAAAGKSSRFNDPHYKKPFAILNQKAVWLHSADRFMKRSDVKQVLIVISSDDRDDFLSKFGPNLAVMGIDVVIGGKERFESVANALKKLRDGIEFVAVHDAVRPCVSDQDIDTVFALAAKTKAAILAVPVANTLKKSVDGKTIQQSVDRSNLWEALTPQVFQRDLLISAYSQIGQLNPTDDAELLEKQGHRVSIAVGSALNIKITTKNDLRLAAACLEAMPKPRFDAPLHPFADGNLWR
jgi:2-C-methyl-D-erythritol 4-phosphate cytidylyltransferase